MVSRRTMWAAMCQNLIWLKKVTGEATYIDDLSRPGMLYAAVLVSPYPHARILSYDKSAALALDGVAAVLTGDDFPEAYMGPFIKDECAIAKGKVRYVGESVAAVAAVDRSTAKQALGLIQVEYEELPAVLSMHDAIAPNATIIHEQLDKYVKMFDATSYANVMSETFYSEGDVDGVWNECDLIIENEYETQAQNHLSMEPCGALASIGENGRVELWSANQSVFRVQANVCETLNLPMNQVRCLTPRIGGGFGNKMEAHLQPIVVALTLATRKPVKITLSREEDFEMVRARHPTRIKCKTGVKHDGTIIARDVEILMDGGAFADDSPGTLGFSLMCARGPYNIPHVRTRGRVVYTNRLRFGAMRGFGNPQATMAGESQLDEIAGRLGMDPIDLRLKNIVHSGDHSYLGQVIASCSLQSLFREGTRGIGLGCLKSVSQ